jgi:hypothetical protein
MDPSRRICKQVNWHGSEGYTFLQLSQEGSSS